MIELTHFRQSDSSRCGPACVRMILDYYGIDDSENDIADMCGWTYENGCSNEGIVHALNFYQLKAHLIDKATMADLEYWIKHRIPVIIDWFVGGEVDDLPNGHSSVVVDIDREKVYLMDPAVKGVRGVLRADFERCWLDWKGNTLTSWDQMTLRQIIVPYPNRFNYNG